MSSKFNQGPVVQQPPPVCKSPPTVRPATCPEPPTPPVLFFRGTFSGQSIDDNPINVADTCQLETRVEPPGWQGAIETLGRRMVVGINEIAAGQSVVDVQWTELPDLDSWSAIGVTDIIPIEPVNAGPFPLPNTQRPGAAATGELFTT
jgi:hypothetical protein